MPKGVYIHSTPGWSLGLTKDTDDRIANLSKALTGRKLSEEHLENRSKAQSGIKRSEETCEKLREQKIGELNPAKRPEVREKMSKSHIGLQAGEKHGMWHGGISFEPYGQEFNKALKEQIRKRDNYQCQECWHLQKDLGYKLPVHHIDYNKKNNHPLNLISLCKSCHGKTFFYKEDWVNYYRSKMESKQ